MSLKAQNSEGERKLDSDGPEADGAAENVPQNDARPPNKRQSFSCDKKACSSNMAWEKTRLNEKRLVTSVCRTTTTCHAGLRWKISSVNNLATLVVSAVVAEQTGQNLRCNSMVSSRSKERKDSR